MVSSPLLVGLTVRISAVATANLNLTCTNEGTAQSTTKTTGSDGKLIFNLGSTSDFSKGWHVGDSISVVCIYTSFEQKFSFTIPASGVTINIKDASAADVGSFIGGSGMSNGFLDLVAAPSLPSIRYFTGTEFLDYFKLKTIEIDAENGVDMVQLTRVGQGVEQEIDSMTNSKFDSNSGSYYSPSSIEGGESPEYHDARSQNQKDYFTDFIPINSVTTFEINQNAEGGTPSWETLTETDNEIAIDNATGRISIINSGKYAERGTRHVRITYVFGRSSVPQDIKQLAIIETGRKLLGAAFLKSRTLKLDNTVVGDLTEFMSYRTKVIRKYRNHTFLAS